MLDDVTLAKNMPQSLEAERAVLGAVLVNTSLFDQIAEILKPHDFYLDHHQKIFSSMETLSSSSSPIDLITLTDELEKNNDLDTVGGATYIASMLDGIPSISNVEQYAHIIREKSLLRRLIHSTNEILISSYSNEHDASELVERAERAIFEISQDQVQRDFRKMSSITPEVIDQLEERYQNQMAITGVPSGFADLDEKTTGFQNSDLIIIAGRPAMGKTSLAMNMACNAAHKGKKIGIFSLEMSSTQLVARLLSSEAEVDSHRIRQGNLNQEDWNRVTNASAKLHDLPLFIDDTPGVSVVEMRSKCRRLKAEHGLDMVILDYLQLMSGSSFGNRGGRYENRQNEISAISRSLKIMAKELEIPVIALSQLSRAPDQRKDDHRPQLSDLRESGSIEQDADVVLFVYRHDIYKRMEKKSGESSSGPESEADMDGLAELIIGKQRNGPTGTVKLVFFDKYTRFDNYTEQAPW